MAPRHADTVPRWGRRLAEWLRRKAYRGPVPFLEPGAWLLALVYALWALSGALRAGAGSGGLVAAAGVSSFLFAGTAAAAHRTTDAELRHGMVAALGGLVVGNAVFRMALGSGPEQVTHLGLALVILGAVVRMRVFLPMAGLAGLAWLLVLQRYPSHDLVSHYTAYLGASTVLAVGLLLARGYRDLEVERARRAGDGLGDDLRVTLGWYRTLFQESPALMCVHDTDGRIEEVNPAGLEALGYARQDVVGRMITEFMVPVTEDGPAEYLRDIQRFGSAEGLLRARRSDGSLRIWEYRSTMLRTGSEVQVLATGADVTELAEAGDWVPGRREVRAGGRGGSAGVSSREG